MLKLLKNDRIASNLWKTLTLSKRDNPQKVRLPVGPLLVPLSVWQARRAELIHREYEHGWPLGIWLAGEDQAEAIKDDIDDFTVIAIRFDHPANSYAAAYLLRENYGYKRELRAIATEDETPYLHNAGFDSLEVNDETNAKTGLPLNTTRQTGVQLTSA